jgi:ATP-dependent RNA helicase DDX46/PRP5
VSSNIKQIIELRSNDEERFARLLEILGELAAAEDSRKTLIFVNSQEKCSNLFQQLLNYGYANQMLHGDMQQVCTDPLQST